MDLEISRFALASSIFWHTENNTAQVKQVLQLEGNSIDMERNKLPPSPLPFELARERLSAFQAFKPYADVILTSLSNGDIPPYPQIGREIATHGNIYVVEHEGKKYAMKFFLPTRADEVREYNPHITPQEAEDFAEASTNQNIVRFFEETEALLRTDDLPFVNHLVAYDIGMLSMVTELIIEPPLREIITLRRESLPHEFLSQLIEKMWLMYQRNTTIDVNPDNLFLKPDGDIIVHDPMLSKGDAWESYLKGMIEHSFVFYHGLELPEIHKLLENVFFTESQQYPVPDTLRQAMNARVRRQRRSR